MQASKTTLNCSKKISCPYKKSEQKTLQNKK